jgi:pyruvate/2-oxoglutarate dehydrogenase complex dihydrolipoamide dehydrogenase (E3) component
VIATGTSPATPRIPGLDTVPFWTNREAVQTSTLPDSLVIIGSGAVGVELAQAFARFGTRVHIVEGMDRILPTEDPEASRHLREALQKDGVEISCSARVERVDKIASGVRVVIDDGEPIEAAQLLVAAGRHPNTDGFDVDAAGVSLNPRGFVQVDPATLKAAQGIYAIGDVNGLGGFTHLSDYHGRVVGRLLRGEAAIADHTAVPRVTFTDPEVAAVGMTEAQARQRGIDPAVALADVATTARGYIHGEPGGCLKLVADRHHGVLVGATIASPRAGEMLSEISLAIKAQLPLTVMADLIHPFPTFSRVFQGMMAELLAQTVAAPSRAGG